jgi:FkbH-like protein
VARGHEEAVLSVEVLELKRQLDGGRTPPGPVLLELARRHAALGDDQEAFQALRRAAELDRSFRTWSAAAALRRKVRSRSQPDGARSVRVGLVGTSTVDQLAQLLPLAGHVADLDLEVHTAGYGQYETSVRDPSGPLHAAGCETIVLVPDAGQVWFREHTADPEPELERELTRWTDVWSAIRSCSTAQIVQANFVPPFERPGGSLDGTMRGGRRRMFAELNHRLADAAGTTVHIVDAEAVAAEHGLARWWDDRYWFHAKQAVSLGAIPELANEIAAVLRARSGRARKCLVVDLDNTLWGGVVGDDGVENLVLEGTAEGEAYLALQEHLLDLQRSGIVLAVCSKNEAEWARAPFLERQDMRLRLEHFAAFVANWEPKPDNLRRISEQLDLGLDAFVFLDDNPVERAIVRELLPDVDVIELPDDPSGYRRALAQYRGFEPSSRTEEDAARTEHYRGRAAAFELRERSTTVEEFLADLEMVAELRPFDTMTLARVTQLVHKTNQWNLTTRRHPASLLERLATDPDAITVSLRLRDRYADHGIVAVAIALQSGDVLDIDTFLMSCRVIGRTVEHAVLDHLVDAARCRGVRHLRGTYVPTPKNALVADLYERLGFAPLGEVDGHLRWELDIDAAGASPRSAETRFIEARFIETGA